jgi:predicted GTPase
LPMMQARWNRFTIIETMGIRTTSELIEKVEESYSLSHEQATREVEFWALDKQL